MNSLTPEEKQLVAVLHDGQQYGTFCQIRRHHQHPSPDPITAECCLVQTVVERAKDAEFPTLCNITTTLISTGLLDKDGQLLFGHPSEFKGSGVLEDRRKILQDKILSL